jgi:hypothetical protein
VRQLILLRVSLHLRSATLAPLLTRTRSLTEKIRTFRFANDFNSTLFSFENADATDRNSQGSHPFYQEAGTHTPETR